MVVLTTFHHFERSLSFKAGIRIRGTDEYLETSIVPKYTEVFSVEQWFDDFDSIVLFDLHFVDAGD